MEKIPPKYFLYLAIALVVGLIFAFGLASMMHQPLPVQVPLTQYQPASPPAPAVPTIAPTVKVTGDKYAPAPAPVIVTTQPLPTITPTENKAATSVICPVLNDTTNSWSSIWIIMMIGMTIFMMAFLRSGSMVVEGVIMLIIVGALFMVMPGILNSVMLSGPCMAVPP